MDIRFFRRSRVSQTIPERSRWNIERPFAIRVEKAGTEKGIGFFSFPARLGTPKQKRGCSKVKVPTL